MQATRYGVRLPPLSLFTDAGLSAVADHPFAQGVRDASRVFVDLSVKIGPWGVVLRV